MGLILMKTPALSESLSPGIVNLWAMLADIVNDTVSSVFASEC